MPPLVAGRGGTNRCAVSPSDRQHGVDIAIERPGHDRMNWAPPVRQQQRERRLIDQTTHAEERHPPTGVGLHSGQKLAHPTCVRHRSTPESSSVAPTRADGADSACAENVGDTTLHHPGQGWCAPSRRSNTCCRRWRLASTTPTSTSTVPKCRSWMAAPVPSSSCCSRQASGKSRRGRKVHPHQAQGRGARWRQERRATPLPVSGGFTIDFDHPVFRNRTQSAEVDFSSTSFCQEVSRAHLWFSS